MTHCPICKRDVWSQYINKLRFVAVHQATGAHEADLGFLTLCDSCKEKLFTKITKIIMEKEGEK